MLKPSSAFKNSQFRRFFLGVFFTVQAIWIQRVSISWIAWERSESPGFVGLIAGLSLLPTLLSGPLFGVIADRVDIRRAAFVTNGSMAVCLTVLAVLLPFVDLAGLAIAALTIGLISSAHHPVRMSLGPRLVPQELVQYVVTVTALNFNLARLVAPAVTGLIIAEYGARTALWTSVVFYLPMLVILIGLRPRPLPDRPNAAFFTALIDGFRFAMASPVIRLAFLISVVFATMVRGALEVLPVLADGAFERGATGLGALTTAAGVGALASASFKLVGVGSSDARISRGVLVATMGGQFAVIGMGLATSWTFVLIATALAGFAATYVGISLQAAIQTNLPDDFRGRVMSLWTVVGFGTVAFGAFGIGGLAELFGIGAALATVGGLGCVAVAAIFVSMRGARI